MKHSTTKPLYSSDVLFNQNATVGVCVWKSLLALTQHSDVDTKRSTLVAHALLCMADVLSRVCQSGLGNVQEGAHAHGCQDYVCQDFHIFSLRLNN